jgi:hypothetical protein
LAISGLLVDGGLSGFSAQGAGALSKDAVLLLRDLVGVEVGANDSLPGAVDEGAGQSESESHAQADPEARV